MNRDFDSLVQFLSAGTVGRRTFLRTGGHLIGAGGLLLLSAGKAFGADGDRYKLAPQSILSAEISKAPEKVREAYRFAIANRETLRYIPCYCGCDGEGHTSNASCYFKDSSTPQNPVFDRMSLA